MPWRERRAQVTQVVGHSELGYVVPEEPALGQVGQLVLQ